MLWFPRACDLLDRGVSWRNRDRSMSAAAGVSTSFSGSDRG